MAYNAELQMLRELAWFVFRCDDYSSTITIPRQCCFCGRSLMDVRPCPGFGHRRHSRPPLELTFHHDDENRDNNTRDNIKLCHPSCHRKYHKALLMAAGKRLEEETNAQSVSKV